MVTTIIIIKAIPTEETRIILTKVMATTHMGRVDSSRCSLTSQINIRIGAMASNKLGTICRYKIKCHSIRWTITPVNRSLVTLKFNNNSQLGVLKKIIEKTGSTMESIKILKRMSG